MYGADVYAKDSTGRRPSDLALLQRDQNPMVRRVLLDYELNPRSLSEFCRLAVLKSMVIRKDVDYVRNLGLPQKIVHFLLGSLTVWFPTGDPLTRVSFLVRCPTAIADPELVRRGSNP